METLFITAFGLSVIFAAQPGVIAVESLRRGLQHGFREALYVELGSLVGDATWALLALLGASFLLHNNLLMIVFGLFGCFLLLRFAWDAWKAQPQEVVPSAEAEQPSRGNAFRAGMMLSLSSPQYMAFWLGMSGMIIGLGFLNPQPLHLAVFFTGFMTAQVLWCFFYASVVSYGRNYMNDQAMQLVNFLTIIVLGYLGIDLLMKTVQIIPQLLGIGAV